MKMVVGRMFFKMNSGKQKAFFMMKLNAQEAKFETRLDDTIKINQQKLLLEKLTGMNKQKAKSLKRLVWSKQLRTQLKAFNMFKTFYKDQIINEKDFSVKDLELKNTHLSAAQQKKE